MPHPLPIALLLLLAAVAARPAAAAAEPETVQFKTLHPDGATLRGFLLKPDAARHGPGPHPSVLLLHGCSGPVTSRGRLAARERAWMNLFAGEGYAALLLDSFNPRGFASICTVGKRPLTAEKDRPYDAYAALGWLRAQGFVDPQRVGVMGWSHGAMTILGTISESMIERIGWREPGFLTAVLFYPGCLETSKTSFRTKVPMLMQLGEKDDWTPVRYCERLARDARGRGARIDMDIYPGAYHAFDNPTGQVRARVVNSGGGDREVHSGADPQARAKSINRVRDWFRAAFKG